MRHNLSKLESAILYYIDTGSDKDYLKEQLLAEKLWSVIEIDQAIRSLKDKDLIHYEDKGTFLIAHFARHYGKDIRNDSELQIYTYEDGK